MEEFLDINGVDASWRPILLPALEALEEEYRRWLLAGEGYIPVRERVLAAFSSLPPHKVRSILFGQDPYPRAESAIGYAFIDGGVQRIFSETGLSRQVNRATSLRNFIKMALVARGDLGCDDLSQTAIASVDKEPLIDSIHDLRRNFERAGLLLLNTALVFRSKEESRTQIRAWRGFVERLLEGMRPLGPELILFGTHAAELRKRFGVTESFRCHELEHPYNTSFVCNEGAHRLFGPMGLLDREVRG